MAEPPVGDVAWIALGSNLDDPPARLRAAARSLNELGARAARSSMYRTAPVGGPPGQAPYLNAVVGLRPRAPWRGPRLLLAALLELERDAGRVRAERWGPRTLDLDLLAFGDARVGERGLQLPHPRMMERAFVLAPLCEAAPAWRHPVSGVSACEALAALGTGGVERTGLAWETG